MGELSTIGLGAACLIPSLWELLWGFSYICFSKAHFQYWL